MTPYQALATLLLSSGPWQAARQAATLHPPHVTRSQEEAAHALLHITHHFRGALLLDPVGAGKTHTALRWAELLSLPFTVLCPAPLTTLWQERSPPHTPIYSLSILSRRTPPIHTPLIIIDEAHHLRNPTTARYQNTAALLPDRQVLLLTATPIHNHTSDLAALLRLFLPEPILRTFPTLLDAAAALCVRRPRDITHRPRRSTHLPTPSPSPSTLNLLSEAAAALASPEDPAPLLFTLLHRRYLSSPHAAHDTLTRALALLSRQLEAASHGHHLSRAAFRSLFPDEAHLHQQVFPFLFTGSPNITPTTHEDLRERYQTLSRVLAQLPPPCSSSFSHLLPHLHSHHTLAFTDYLPTAHALFSLLESNHPTLLLTGTSAHASRIGTLPRTHAVSFFRQGHPLLPPGPRTLITTRVASEGLDLPEASQLVHLDLPWTAATLEQRRGRLDRPTNTTPYLELTCTPPTSSPLTPLTLLHKKNARAQHLLHTLEHLHHLRSLPLPPHLPPIITLEYAQEDAIILASTHTPIALTWRDGWTPLDTLSLLARLHMRASYLRARPATSGERLRATVAARETAHWHTSPPTRPLPHHAEHTLSLARSAFDAHLTQRAHHLLQHDLAILHTPLTPHAARQLSRLPADHPNLLQHYLSLGHPPILSTWNGVALILKV